MKRLIAVLLVLVGTAAMSFAGTCRFHGAYDGFSCPGCRGANARMEGRENPCEKTSTTTDRYICNTEYTGN